MSYSLGVNAENFSFRMKKVSRVAGPRNHSQFTIDYIGLEDDNETGIKLKTESTIPE